MTASFVQVESLELARLTRDPSLAEALFAAAPGTADAMAAFSKMCSDRLKAVDPQKLVEALGALPPAAQQRMAERFGNSPEEWAAALAGGGFSKLVEERRYPSPPPGTGQAPRPAMSLEKAWHGVHYVLCGESEPGVSLLSQPVLGGTPLGDDDEGFSGYGPARYFNVAQTAQLAQALSEEGLDAKVTARFDPARMSDLGIYPGWKEEEDDDEDKDWVMDAFSDLRAFYADAASNGRAIVTCIV
ncbi:MAG TPA: DUF1877 family protein [Candidatus Cybelea sp.]|nr:DUF1877 family protein [Candidatus Cybelea sp.]